MISTEGYRIPVFFTRVYIGGNVHVFDVSQAPDRKPNDLYHSEPEFISKTLKDLEIGVREADRRGLQLLSRHCDHFYNIGCRRVLDSGQSGII